MNLPNRLTLLRVLCAPLYLWLLSLPYEWSKPVALVVFLLASLTDLLDGRLARKHGLVTTLGKFLDPIADKLLVLPAFILMVSLGTVPAWMCILFVARELVVSGMRMVAAEQGVVIAAGPWGKAKTVAQMIAICLLTLNLPPLRLLNWIALYGALLLTVYSGWDYLYNARHLLLGRKDD